jgi:hypothetical protein
MEMWNPDSYRGNIGKKDVGSEQPTFVQSLAEMMIKTQMKTLLKHFFLGF